MYHRCGFYHHWHGFGRGFGRGFGFRAGFHFPPGWGWFEPFGWGFRPWPRREDYIRGLEEYRDELKKELEEVEKELADLKSR